MKNPDILIWVAGGLWGAVLGIFYFGGLWLTVQFLPRSSRPFTHWFFSFVGRLSLSLVGMWVVLQKDGVAFFITLTVFFGVRGLIRRKVVCKTEVGKTMG
jgi:F1F0 ATPase subunit 2